MQHTTTTSTSRSTNMIPKGTALKGWRMCEHAAMALMMLVLSRVAGTTIIITIITRCPRSHNSLVPNLVPLVVVAGLLLPNSNSNSSNSSNNNSNNTHPDRRLPPVGLSAPANPTEARVPVKMAEAACSPGPRGRGKSLHQYDRRFQYIWSSFPYLFYIFSFICHSYYYFSTIMSSRIYEAPLGFPLKFVGPSLILFLSCFVFCLDILGTVDPKKLLPLPLLPTLRRPLAFLGGDACDYLCLRSSLIIFSAIFCRVFRINKLIPVVSVILFQCPRLRYSAPSPELYGCPPQIAVN
jgi:hypothetical protein